MTSWGADLTAQQFGPNTYQFILESTGPDLIWHTDPLGGPVGGGNRDRFHYDPTNGALSQGQIVFTDRGFEFGDERIDLGEARRVQIWTRR